MEKMVVLHFACIDNDKTSGVCVVVPQHVRAQGRYARTAIINVNGFSLDDGIEQIEFSKPFDLRKLPQPFDRPDLVVFHECYRPAYLAVGKALQKDAVPYIIIPHGELRREAQRKKHLKKAAANLLLFNSFINHAAALQCLSENELKATAFGKRKFVGTNGIAIQETAKERFSENEVKFVFIGRYEWKPKGLDLLFDAIKLKEQFLRDNNCSFSLYGPDVHGRFAAVSAMVKEREIGDLVCLHHEITGSEKREVLLDADVFVQTSRHEGMPMGILEAMSYGLPCLVTEGTSLAREVAEANAGWTAETRAEDIALRLEQAVKDRVLWLTMGANGRNAIEQHFSWDKIAQEALSSYKRLLSEK